MLEYDLVLMQRLLFGFGVVLQQVAVLALVELLVGPLMSAQEEPVPPAVVLQEEPAPPAAVLQGDKSHKDGPCLWGLCELSFSEALV